MTGHEQLRAMRRAKRVPRCVWITDGDDIRAHDWHEEANCADQQRHAVISIAAGDIPEALDLRSVIGLEVHLCGERGESRALRIHASLIEAGARCVITSIPATGDLLLHGVALHG